ncbi:MAG TPA: YceH family protein [Nevskiaceae bacterium]|nr:YceH family protein [Nevskiaceae bacterium]
MSLELNPIEARVVASLVEKSITTPQYYPMSVNALAAACNQKNGRHPVMSLSEGDVGAALGRLEELRLAKRDDQGSRVAKWRHRFNHEMLLKDPATAVLVTLMLRGPQTFAELRANAAALGGPPDVEGVQATLRDLADRAQPLVSELARAPGQSATRWRHRVTNEADPEPEAMPPPARERSESGGTSALEARIAALEARVQELEKLIR